MKGQNRRKNSFLVPRSMRRMGDLEMNQRMLRTRETDRNMKMPFRQMRMTLTLLPLRAV